MKHSMYKHNGTQSLRLSQSEQIRHRITQTGMNERRLRQSEQENSAGKCQRNYRRVVREEIEE